MTYVIRLEKTNIDMFASVRHPVEYVDWCDIADGDFTSTEKQENARKFADWEINEVLEYMAKLTTCNRSFRFWAVKYNPAPVFVKDERYELNEICHISVYEPKADQLFVGKMFVEMGDCIKTIKYIRAAAGDCSLLTATLFCEDCAKFYTATKEYKKAQA